MHLDKIKEKLSEKNLELLARQSGFIKSNHYLISPYAYVLGFFQMLKNGFNTVEIWASEIYQVSGHMVSPQGLQKRIQYPQVDFCKSLLEQILGDQVQNCSLLKGSCQLLKDFKNVFVEDSTCVTLPVGLFEFFPGSVNQKGSSSSARIQLRVELKQMLNRRIELQSYRDNDRKFAGDILDQVRQGDLIIRDLGYHVLDVFQQMSEKGVSFLSRLLFGSTVYDKQTGAKLNLAKELRRLRIQGINTLDREVLLGKKAQLPVRLIALKVTPRIEQERKRKTNRDRRVNRSKEYMELLGWTIFITNVEPEIWSPQEVLKVYSYRWRIEIIFKCWKQQLNFKQLLKNKGTLSPPRVEISFYLILIWLTLCYSRIYSLLLIKVYESTGKVLSLHKFGSYLKSKPEWLKVENYDKNDIKYLAKYFAQTKRKEKSHTELLYALNSS